MCKDNKISMKTYQDMQKTQYSFILHDVSLHLHTSKWGYDIGTWGSPKKMCTLDKMSEMWVLGISQL